MNWYGRFRKCATQMMPMHQALQIMGLMSVPNNLAALRSHRNKILRKYNLHPDHGGNNANMINLNNAFETLEKAIENGSQTDERSGYTKVDKSPARAWMNLNRCLADIDDETWKNGGDGIPTQFMAFDGHLFGGIFTANCNEATLPFGAKVMEYWNSHGGNPYKSAAVFVMMPNHTMRCLRMGGRPIDIVVPIEREFDDDAEPHMRMPYNDERFMIKLRQWVEDQKRK